MASHLNSIVPKLGHTNALITIYETMQPNNCMDISLKLLQNLEHLDEDNQSFIMWQGVCLHSRNLNYLPQQSHVKYCSLSALIVDLSCRFISLAHFQILSSFSPAPVDISSRVEQIHKWLLATNERRMTLVHKGETTQLQLDQSTSHHET